MLRQTTRRYPRHSMVSVAIIGAGPAGLASARVLIANGDSYQIDMFESHEQIGGCLLYTSRCV